MNTCVFCRIARHEQEPENIIYEDNVVVVFPGLHQRPRNQGHVEVITRDHVPTVYELTDSVAARVMVVIRQVAIAARAAFRAEGITLHQHNEPAGGAHADHFHMHVVPRHVDDQYWASVGIREHEFIEVPAAVLSEQAERMRTELRVPLLGVDTERVNLHQQSILERA